MNFGGTPIAFECALTSLTKSSLKNSVEMEKERVAWAFCSLLLTLRWSRDDSLLRDMFRNVAIGIYTGIIMTL